MRWRRHDQPVDREADLAALADGSLPESRRPVVQAAVEESPELAALLAEQERAVTMVRTAVADVEAPSGLRRRLEAAQQRRRRPRPLAFAGAAATLAAAALVLVLVLPGGAGGPTVAEAATIGVRGSAAPAPAPRAVEPKLLARDVEGVAFPSWTESFGWEATGARTDELAGRDTATVFYEKDGKEIAYTIVGGDALEVPGDAQEFRREGTDLLVFHQGDRLVVTWQRNGKTCILSGTGVTPDVLVKLAAWKGEGAVDF
jgi:hypothetical protein